jgi:hypothetical protein
VLPAVQLSSREHGERENARPVTDGLTIVSAPLMRSMVMSPASESQPYSGPEASSKAMVLKPSKPGIGPTRVAPPLPGFTEVQGAPSSIAAPIEGAYFDDLVQFIDRSSTG